MQTEIVNTSISQSAANKRLDDLFFQSFTVYPVDDENKLINRPEFLKFYMDVAKLYPELAEICEERIKSMNLSLLQVKMDCSICFEEKLGLILTECQHNFHSRCLSKWITTKIYTYQKPVCPLCKTAIDHLGKKVIGVWYNPLPEKMISYFYEKKEIIEMSEKLNQIIIDELEDFTFVILIKEFPGKLKLDFVKIH